MKTTLTLGALCVLALCAMPLASADITVGFCLDATHCAARAQATPLQQCQIYETPTSGSAVDMPSTGCGNLNL